MSEVVVYGIPGSPYYRAALLGLEEKKIPYRLSFLPMGSGAPASASGSRAWPRGRACKRPKEKN